MSESAIPGSITLALKRLGEISGYVADILAYLLAITGNLSTPYPSTVSVLTVVVSLAILWIWRWPKIVERKPSSGIQLPASEQQIAFSSKEHLVNLLRGVNTHFYRTSLPQMRIEVAMLVVLSVGALVFGSTKYSAIRVEISGLNCPKASPGPRIVIADFVSAEPHQFENSLRNVMALSMRNTIEICRYYHEVKLVEDAEEIGQRYNASLVIWGSNINNLFEVFLTSSEWDLLSERKSRGLSPSDSQEDITLIAANINAEILYNENELITAQQYLSQALRMAENWNGEKTNPDLLSEDYYLLGLLFDPAETNNSDTIKDAIDAYSKAVRFNRLGSALFNRGWLYLNSGDAVNAEADFSTLISESYQPTLYVYFGRAKARLAQGKWQETIYDVNAALQDPDMNPTHDLYPDLHHVLATAFLLGGNYNGAEMTYEKIIPLLRKDDIAGFKKDLDSLAANDPGNPALREEVAKIKKLLQPVQS